ncbi:hypothetical protein QE152_g22558 [Popillia japonica]|uniref:Uncharacterized protein n=1 Tax=Popillia japonica TaxID=7064 RepID=A0AAW1KIH9_POPJA
MNLKECAYMVGEAWSLVKAVEDVGGHINKLGAWLRQWKMLEGISTEGEKEKKKKEKEAPVTEREETGENEGDLSFKGLRFV